MVRQDDSQVVQLQIGLTGLTVLSGETEPATWLADSNPERPNYIAMANGILDLDALLAGKTNVLRPHTTQWFSPICLPYSFDPDADFICTLRGETLKGQIFAEIHRVLRPDGVLVSQDGQHLAQGQSHS